MTEPCIQLETIGKIKEFVESCKGIKIQLGATVFAIVLQVSAFLFMWGSLTNTVNKNTEYVWGDLTSMTRENMRNLDRLMAKLEDVRFIAFQGEPGPQGIQGIRGAPGPTGISARQKEIIKINQQ